MSGWTRGRARRWNMYTRNAASKTRPTLTCSECGEPLRPEEVKPQTRAGTARASRRNWENEGESHPDIPPLLRRSM